MRWERVVLREGWRDAGSAGSVAATVRLFFADYRIEPGLYRNVLWPDLPTLTIMSTHRKRPRAGCPLQTLRVRALT